MPPPNAAGAAVCELPPLILHPFNERVAPNTLMENSRAALMLAGLIPDEGAGPDALARRVLAGRYSEIRMLYFVGKDVMRWIGQCCEAAARLPDGDGLEGQSFAGLLTANPPAPVREKLIRWGVADHAAIFARAVGLQAIFAEPPPIESLSEEFLRNYHRYADALFRCYMESRPHRIAPAGRFRFDLYASGEYSRLLETEWGEAEG